MSDQQAQELTPAERETAIREALGLARSMIACGEQMTPQAEAVFDKARLAARAPVPVERPDEAQHLVKQGPDSTGYGYRATCSCGWTGTAASLDGVETAGDVHRLSVAARLPEQPDEGPAATCECCGKRALEPITDPEEGIDFCPRCAIDGAVAVASEARPADEGITDAMVEAAKKAELDTIEQIARRGERFAEPMRVALEAALALAAVLPEEIPTSKGD